MKKILKSSAAALIVGSSLLIALPAQAFWGPFDWFDDDDDWYGPGESVTVPKGDIISIQGRVNNVTGPSSNVTFTDGLIDIDPGFWEFSVTCRD